MRIAHVLPQTGRLLAGPARSCLALATAQAHLGHDVLVYCWGKAKQEGTSTSVPERRYERPRMRGFCLDRELRDRLDTNGDNLDLLHLHSVYIPANWRIARHARCPVVLSPRNGYSPWVMRRGTLKKSLARLFFEGPMARRTLAIHALSERERQDCLAYGTPDRFIVAPNGVDLEGVDAALAGRRRRDERNGPPKLVFLGRLDVLCKGLDLLLNAVRRVLDAGHEFSLRLVGPPDRGSDLLPGRIARLGLEGLAAVVPPVRGAEKYCLLADADLYVQASRWEGIPLSVLEAMACRTPVLVTRATNLGDYVDGAGCGGVCEATEDGLAAKLVELLRLAGELPSMGNRARELVEESFTWNRVARTVCDGYEYWLRAGEQH